MKSSKFFIGSLFAFFLLPNIVFSQLNFQYNSWQYNANGAACDGAAKMEATFYSPNHSYYWYDDAMNLLGTNDSIGGLCPGWYYCFILDTNCNYTAGYFQILNDSQIYSTEFIMDFDEQDISPNLVRGNVIGLGDPFDICFTDFIDWSFFCYDTLDNFTFSGNLDTLFTNVNLLYLEPAIAVTDGTGNSIAQFYYRYDPDFGCYLNLFAYAQGLPVSDSLLCDGSAFAYPLGGVPPYSYSFSSGSIDSTETGLCPGVYQITITDAASNQNTSSFVVGLPNTIYFNDFDMYSYEDTLYANASALCGLDYTIPPDSFFVDTMYYYTNFIQAVEWIIFQDTNVYEVTEYYHFDTAGFYVLGLSVFCEEIRNEFNSFTLMDSVYYQRTSPHLSINEQVVINSNFNLFPNPASDRVKISLRNNLATENNYQLYNLMGSLVKTGNFYGNETWINTTAFADGVYTLVIGGEAKKLVISR